MACCLLYTNNGGHATAGESKQISKLQPQLRLQLQSLLGAGWEFPQRVHIRDHSERGVRGDHHHLRVQDHPHAAGYVQVICNNQWGAFKYYVSMLC